MRSDSTGWPAAGFMVIARSIMTCAMPVSAAAVTGSRGGPAAVVAPNQLQQQFDVEAPNRVWATDITYIRTHEGWLYLAAVLDLFSRQVVGWSMQSRMTRELVMQALLMAVWRRRPNRR